MPVQVADKTKKVLMYAGAAVGVVAGIAVAFAMPAAGLGSQASQALGILIWAIVWWVLRIFPEMVTAFIMAVLFIAVADIPVETVFASFTGETWWLLFAAFGLGVGMKQSGLVTRIAHFVLEKFPGDVQGASGGYHRIRHRHRAAYPQHVGETRRHHAVVVRHR